MLSQWGQHYATATHHLYYPGTVYNYISGFCFSEIMFQTLFSSDPLNKEAGLQFRRLVLENGGSQDPMEMMEKLLGERPDIEAWCDKAVDV
jgi:metallopeptidase MepB